MFTALEPDRSAHGAPNLAEEFGIRHSTLQIDVVPCGQADHAATGVAPQG